MNVSEPRQGALETSSAGKQSSASKDASLSDAAAPENGGGTAAQAAAPAEKHHGLLLQLLADELVRVSGPCRPHDSVTVALQARSGQGGGQLRLCYMANFTSPDVCHSRATATMSSDHVGLASWT